MAKRQVKKIWEKAMPKAQYELMKEIIEAPSPIGSEKLILVLFRSIQVPTNFTFRE